MMRRAGSFIWALVIGSMIEGEAGILAPAGGPIVAVALTWAFEDPTAQAK
jgi:hypothetical protein